MLLHITHICNVNVSQKCCINAINSKALRKILTMIQKFRAYNVFSNLEALPWQRVIYKQNSRKKENGTSN